MTIEQQAVEMLADAFKEYYNSYEVDDICSSAGLSVDYHGTEPDYPKLASKLCRNANQENIRSFLKQTCSDLIDRIEAKMELAPAEDQIFHQQMKAQLQGLIRRLQETPVIQETVIAAEPTFLDSMSKAQAFFGTAQGNVIVVDPHIDARSLSCFSGVRHRIRYLTRIDTISNSGLLEATLEKHRTKGIHIAVRCHKTIHDRYIAFNDCCWLSNTSLHDIDTTPLHLIEIRDSKKLILNDIARKWNEAVSLA
jgi:hypothetical protein